MSAVQTLTCPNCGSNLEPQPGQTQIKCHACGTMVMVPNAQLQPAQFQSFRPNIVIEPMSPVSIPIGGGISKAAIIVPIIIVIVILGFVGFIISNVMGQVGKITDSAIAPFSNVLTSVPQIKQQFRPTIAPRPTDVPPPTAAPKPTAAPTALPTPQTFSKVILRDSLAKKVNDWSVTNENGNTLGFADGGYEIASTTANNGESTWILDGYKDVSVEVDAQATTGAGSMGVLCRVKEGIGGYSFEVNTDGTYGIIKYTFTSSGADSTELETGSLPDGLLKANDANHLRGDCLGTNLTLVLNGQTVATTVNSAMKTGGFGLVATSSSDSSDGMTVLFKNLAVKGP